MAELALLSRFTQDVGVDTRLAARYIGNLEGGRSNVSVNSALSVTDRVDHFRLKVTEDGFVRIRTGELVGQDGTGNEVVPNGTVRYQILSPSGDVIADSNPDAGAAFDAYQKLTSDENLQLGKGTYVIRVSRDKAAIDTKDYVYSFTFRSDSSPVREDDAGRAVREFLTTERPGSGVGVDLNAGIASVLGLFSQVNLNA